MKAAEALVLGSAMMKPLVRVLDNGKAGDARGGCALGMINAAIGGDAQHQIVQHKFRWMSATKILLPCGCASESSVYDGVMHLFDVHHTSVYGEWTVTRIAEWLASVDPTPIENPIVVYEEHELVHS